MYLCSLLFKLTDCCLLFNFLPFYAVPYYAITWLAAGNIEIVRCPDGYGVGDVYCTKSDTGVIDYDAHYPFETASYISRTALRKVRVSLAHRCF